MIEVRCACGHKLVIFPHHAGTTLDCPKCKQPVDVPVPEGGVPSEPRVNPADMIPDNSLIGRLLRFIRGE